MTTTKIEAFYSRRVAPKDWEHKEAHATIAVSHEDLNGGDIITHLDEAMEQAVDIVHRYIGIGAGGKTAGKTGDTPISTSQCLGTTEPETAPETEELTRGQKAAITRAKNKAAKEAEEADKPPVEEVAQEDVTTRSPEPEPEDDDDLIDMDAPVSEEAPDLEPEETFDEISDADLGAEINKKAKLLKAEGDPEAVARVKAAIASFNTDGVDPFTAGMMSQSQRRKFFAKLDALKVRKGA